MSDPWEDFGGTSNEEDGPWKEFGGGTAVAEDVGPWNEFAPLDREAIKRDLAEQKRDLELERVQGDVTEKLIDAARIGLKSVAPFDVTGTATREMLRQGEQPLPPVIPPEALRPDVGTLVRFGAEGLGNLGIPIPADIQQGATEFGAEMGSAVTDPAVGAAIATGAIAPRIAPQVAPRVNQAIQRYFQAQMTGAIPQASEALFQAETPVEQVKGALNLGMAAGAPLAIQAHINAANTVPIPPGVATMGRTLEVPRGAPRPRVEPIRFERLSPEESARLTEQMQREADAAVTPGETGAPNAIPIRETTEVPLGEPPGVSPQVEPQVRVETAAEGQTQGQPLVQGGAREAQGEVLLTPQVAPEPPVAPSAKPSPVSTEKGVEGLPKAQESSTIQENERLSASLQTAEDFTKGEIQKTAIGGLGRLDERSPKAIAFDLSEWTDSSKAEVQNIPEVFVYTPEGTSKFVVEFPVGTRPQEAIQSLLEAIKSGDGPGSGWLPIAQENALKEAVKKGQPILAEAADQHGIKPPKGYVKEGGIYRRMDHPKAGAGIAESESKRGLVAKPPLREQGKAPEAPAPSALAPPDNSGKWIEVWRRDRSDAPTEGFREGSHWGTKEQADAIAKRELEVGRKPGKLHHAWIKVTNPLKTFDGGFWEKPIAEAKAKGNDAVVYENEGEGVGGLSYIPLSKEQIKIIPEAKPPPIEPGEAARKAPPSAATGELGTGEAVTAAPQPPAMAQGSPLAKVTQGGADPRTLSDAELSAELGKIKSATDPLYEQLDAMPEGGYTGPKGKATREAQAILDAIQPFSRRKELIDFEVQRRANEVKNKAMFEARDKRVAEAKVYQRRNGWEIIKDGVEYVLRDPATKEDVYRGKLKRVREVADESMPAEPPAPPPTPAPGGKGTLSATAGARKATPEGAARVEAAKQRLRDVINNPDIVGKQRADMIANGKQLIAFLEANADTRKPIETDTFKGDQIAFTGVTTPEGYREFIYLEGAKAGDYGVKPSTAQPPAAKIEQEVKQTALQPTPPTEGKMGGEIVGMGGAKVGEKPPQAQIEQLTDAFKGIESAKEPLLERIKKSFSLGLNSSTASDAVGRAVNGLKTAGDYLIGKWRGIPTVNEFVRAEGELSGQLETRGWRVREWVHQAKKAVPSRRMQAAISKWVDAGGDRAALEQGLAETKPEFKRAYQDALDLKGDMLVAAENIRNYFDSRLQEAIDAGVVKQGVEDYIHRLYESRPKIAQQAIARVQSGLLKPNPGLIKKRVFDYDWEAEKLGYRPVQSFVDRIAAYEAALSKAIASREFIKKATTMKAADGRPVVDVKGVGIPIEEEGVREGTLIKPQFNPAKSMDPGTQNYRGDYVNKEFPSLSKWKWVSNDAAGKPIYVQGDVAIHPDYANKITALLEPSRVRYGKYGSVMRPLLTGSSTIKQTMLSLSGFHQVQITVHGMEHKVMPWKIVDKIDFADPNVEALLKGGVTLGGEHYGGYSSEGLFGTALTHKIPWLGPLAESYQNWLFQSYIPRIKLTMGLNALERNRARFAGKMTDEQIAFKTAYEANAAFGELNYILLERSKTTQDLARLILLAPDFLEARGRFALEGLEKGGKSKIPGFGNEQRAALLLGAMTMYVTARIANKILDDQYHFEPENLFSVVYKNHSYSLRTVQGDILHLLSSPLQFWLNRLNPGITRPALQLLTGRDYFGRKRTPIETIADTTVNMAPISLRHGRERTIWESLSNSLGVNVKRYLATDDAFKLAKKWKDANGIGEKGEFIYDADKDPLRPLKIALSAGSDVDSANEIKKLFATGYNRKKLNDYFKRYATMPFTGSRSNDLKWKQTLGEDERKTVDAATEYKRTVRDLYFKALGIYDSTPEKPQ